LHVPPQHGTSSSAPKGLLQPQSCGRMRSRHGSEGLHPVGLLDRSAACCIQDALPHVRATTHGDAATVVLCARQAARLDAEPGGAHALHDLCIGYKVVVRERALVWSLLARPRKAPPEHARCRHQTFVLPSHKHTARK